MQYEIKGTPFPVVICRLEANEAFSCQKGAMAWKSPNMKMETNAGGGVKKAFSRAFSGESMFRNIYTAEGGPGEIAFAVSAPGNIIPVEISDSKTIVAQKSAYLASSTTVDTKIFFNKKVGAGLFGGEGFIMQQLIGQGIAFLEIDGSVVEYDLKANECIDIDTGCLAAMDATCKMDVHTVGGVKNALFGGEGLFITTVTGPGHIWLQTMPISSFAGSIRPYVSSGS